MVARRGRELFAGEPQHPVTRALTPYGITALRLNEIIDGVKMNLDQTRYLDFVGLERYCHRVWRRGSWPR